MREYMHLLLSLMDYEPELQSKLAITEKANPEEPQTSPEGYYWRPELPMSKGCLARCRGIHIRQHHTARRGSVFAPCVQVPLLIMLEMDAF